MQLPNVTIVAAGEKERKPVIRIYVTHKVPEFELSPHQYLSEDAGWL